MKTMMDYKECPTNWRRREAYRTFNWKNLKISAILLASGGLA
jgi:hypothetical protein